MVNLRRFQKFLDGATKVAEDAYETYENEQSRADPSSSSTTPAAAAVTTTTPSAAAEVELDDGANIPLSECTGNKKSLFIGINYFGTQSELRGCINDVNNIKECIVTNFHFPTDTDHMKILVDNDDNNMPTKENILNGFKWLINDAKVGDSLFLHYSGHGGSQNDNDTDDPDGKDETLCPCDYDKAGVIVDDDIHEELVSKLPQGVRLTCIMDCCHSGSVLDLPYTYGVDGNDDIIEVDNRKAVLDAAMQAGMSLLKGDKQEALKSGIKALTLHFSAPAGGGGEGKQSLEPTEQQIQLRSTLADVIQFSGCRDTQTSADAQIDGQATGALSWSIIKAFDEHGINQSYVDLLKNIRTILNGKYTQVPQMSTGHKMDMKTTFVM